MDDDSFLLVYSDGSPNGVGKVGDVSGSSITLSDKSQFQSNVIDAVTAKQLSSTRTIIAYLRGSTGYITLASYTTSSGASGSSGGAQAHRDIRKRYQEINLGLHGSAEQFTDKDGPSLRDVGIFHSGGGSGGGASSGALLVPVQKVSTAPVQLSRKAQRLVRLLTEGPSPAPKTVSVESNTMQDRVCARVMKSFAGLPLERVNARLVKRFGWSC